MSVGRAVIHRRNSADVWSTAVPLMGTEQSPSKQVSPRIGNFVLGVVSNAARCHHHHHPHHHPPPQPGSGAAASQFTFDRGSTLSSTIGSVQPDDYPVAVKITTG